MTSRSRCFDEIQLFFSLFSHCACSRSVGVSCLSRGRYHLTLVVGIIMIIFFYKTPMPYRVFPTVIFQTAVDFLHRAKFQIFFQFVLFFIHLFFSTADEVELSEAARARTIERLLNGSELYATTTNWNRKAQNRTENKTLVWGNLLHIFVSCMCFSSFRSELDALFESSYHLCVNCVCKCDTMTVIRSTQRVAVYHKILCLSVSQNRNLWNFFVKTFPHFYFETFIAALLCPFTNFW